MINYEKRNLFSAGLGSILAHACNCRGKWGAGVALEFKKRFPITFGAYKSLCQHYGSTLLGTCFLAEESGYKIACLFTSSDLGDDKDSEEDILRNTYKALIDLEDQLVDDSETINMPKINSGLFDVAWEHTEKVIESTGLNVTVYSLQ